MDVKPTKRRCTTLLRVVEVTVRAVEVVARAIVITATLGATTALEFSDVNVIAHIESPPFCLNNRAGVT